METLKCEGTINLSNFFGKLRHHMSRSFGVVILLSLHFSDFSGRNFLVFELWTVQSLDKLKALYLYFHNVYGYQT